MSTRTFLIALLAIPAAFVALDLVDLARARARQERHDRVGPEALGFLGLVLVLYAAIQFGTTALAPSAVRVTEGVRAAVAAWLGREPASGPMGSGWLVLLAVVLFYVSGLWDYLLHRYFNHSRRFFFTHEYHHLPSQVNLAIPGMAVRPFAVVVSFPGTLATVVSAYGLLLLLGLPLWDLSPLKVLVLVQAVLLTVTHSCFMRRFWPVHHAMKWLALTTPQEHLLHHTVSLRGNYGNFTVLWDRLFGTYLDPERAEHRDPALGLGYDQDFIGALTLGRLKLPASVRDRFQVGRFCNITPAPDGLPEPAVAGAAREAGAPPPAPAEPGAARAGGGAA